MFKQIQQSTFVRNIDELEDYFSSFNDKKTMMSEFRDYMIHQIEVRKNDLVTLKDELLRVKMPEPNHEEETKIENEKQEKAKKKQEAEKLIEKDKRMIRNKKLILTCCSVLTKILR